MRIQHWALQMQTGDGPSGPRAVSIRSIETKLRMDNVREISKMLVVLQTKPN